MIESVGPTKMCDGKKYVQNLTIFTDEINQSKMGHNKTAPALIHEFLS